MPTFTALTTLSDETRAQALGEALEELDPEPIGVGVFELEDDSGLWEVGAYFTEMPDDIELTLMAAAFGAAEFAVSELPDIDWVAHVRRELKPVEAGRFYVYGSHDADTLPEGRIGLLIEAAMAFGTGHHGTTLGCLKALDTLISDGFHAKNAIDVGCGTAVLAMAAAKVWPETVLASDIDQVAVDVADANVVANDLAGRVTCLEAVGFEHPDIRNRAPFDLIFANILKGPLVMLAPDMGKYAAKDGLAILSGLLNTQAEDIINAYTAQGFEVVARNEIGDWTTLILRRA